MEEKALMLTEEEARRLFEMTHHAGNHAPIEPEIAATMRSVEQKLLKTFWPEQEFHRTHDHKELKQ